MVAGETVVRKVLLVEDDPVIGRTLSVSLPYRGYEVTVSETLAGGFKAFQQEPFDLILLDLVLPDGQGFDLCRKIHEENPLLPILMVTARTGEDDVVRALTLGASDYIRKPFGLEELTARMNRIIDRKKAREEILHYRSLFISKRERLVKVDGQSLSLGPREFEILSILVERAGDVVTRNDILDALSGESDLYDRTIDSHLSHLRSKIRDVCGDRIRIQSVYGVGYRLDSPEE